MKQTPRFRGPSLLLLATVHLLIFASGLGKIAGQPFREGEAWLIPAASAPFSIEPDGPVKFLRTWVP